MGTILIRAPAQKGERVKTNINPTLLAEGAETRARLAARPVQDRQSGTQHKRLNRGWMGAVQLELANSQPAGSSYPNQSHQEAKPKRERE
jgi:hypothetical protein